MAAYEGRGRLAFFAPDRGDLIAWERRRPAVAVGDRGDMYFPTEIGQPNQHAAAEKLRVIRMRHE